MRWPYLMLTLAYCAVVWWLSSQPEPVQPPRSFPGMDKAAHAVLFGGLGAVVHLGLRRSGRYTGRGILFWAPVAFVALYGAIDEFHQSFVPPRVPSFGDWAADVAGAVLLLGVWTLYTARKGGGWLRDLLNGAACRRNGSARGK